jgi:hypothetical protein
MGMQCHFSMENVTDQASAHCSISYMQQELEDKYIDYSILITEDGIDMAFNSDMSYDSCWFDIGFMSPIAMRKLQWLIKHRICFNCS